MYREYFEYNIEIEKLVLGAILIESTAFPRIKGLVEFDMFYNSFHKDIFKCMTEMFNNSQPIDIATLTQYMYTKKYKYDLIGYEISLLINHVASTAHLEYHCLLIRELYTRRLLLEIKNSINSDSDTLDEVKLLEDKLKRARQINASNDWERFKDILIEIRKNLDNPIEEGIKLGIKDFDNISGGIKESEFVIIGARPSVGKTAFACQVALHIARTGKNVCIISLEMSNTKLSTRILSQISGLEYWKIDRKMLNSESETEILNKSIDENYNLPIYFSEKTGVTIEDIRAKALKAKYANNIDVLFIDYLGLIEPEKANNREQEISKISRGLKLLAIELNIPIVVLAQLNRETEATKQKPKLSNLRDSGSIEQDADIVIFLYSEYKAGIITDSNGISTENKRDLIVAKYRNGYTKDIMLGWDGERMKFFDLDSLGLSFVGSSSEKSSIVF